MSNPNPDNLLTKAQVVNRFLKPKLEVKGEAESFAPSNIALSKYWGKREAELNLPINPSLSVSLGHLGTRTTIKLSDSNQDQVKLNGQLLAAQSAFSLKVIRFVNLFRRDQHIPLIIDTFNNIPTAAGLASSASGFAALVLALDEFFDLQLEKPVLSAFARMGSGSASRSVYSGFVRWNMGVAEDGMDSCAVQLEQSWPSFCIGLIKVSSAQKPVDSRNGMNRTIETSQLYQSWPEQAMRDIENIEEAIKARDIERLGSCAEQNAMSMHATMISAWPPLVYWLPESLAVMQKVWQLRESGVKAYITMDAGPNIKLLFEELQLNQLTAEFPEMEVVRPFLD